MNEPIISVDVGGSKIRAALVNADGTISKAKVIETEANGDENVLAEQIVGLVVPLKKGSSSPVAVAVPGGVDIERDIITHAPNIPGLQNKPLRSLLEKKLERPVFLINDVRAATLGEQYFGMGKDSKDFICIFIGTGVGGGIVVDNKIVNGSKGGAGEIGHMSVDFEGPQCRCGNKGCLEVFCGGFAIAEYAKKLLPTYSLAGKLLLSLCDEKMETLTAKTVFQAYEMGDALSNLIIERFKAALGSACVSLIHLFNPTSVIFGGGIVEGFPEIIPFIEHFIQEHSLEISRRSLRILKSTLNSDAVLLGASKYLTIGSI